MEPFTKTEVIDLMLAAARQAALESTATHPEDIAAHMVFAIDTAAYVADYLNKQG